MDLVSELLAKRLEGAACLAQRGEYASKLALTLL
jgi:hypothetical protein